MLEPELKNLINKKYSGIGNILSTEKVTEGYLSQNYILKSSKGAFFLKQYRNTYSEDEIKDIGRVASFFSRNNIPVILPLPTNQDKTYFIFNNRIYSLFPFVNGVKIDRKDIDKKSIISLAKILAKTHRLSLNNPPVQISARQGAIDSTRFLNDSPKIIKVLDSIKEKSPFDELALEGLSLKRSIVEGNIEKIKSLKVKADHLLHGDYHEKNVFVDNKGEIKYIFDLEKTEIGDRLHEVIRSMDFICLNEEYDEKGMEKAHIYIKAYNELYPIEQKDFLDALENYYFKKANSLWIEKTHYLEGSDRVDCFLETQLASLKFFPENFDRLVRLLEV
jgi:Ser/Thr protein kinase RdoA (MazF antagonist)